MEKLTQQWLQNTAQGKLLAQHLKRCFWFQLPAVSHSRRQPWWVNGWSPYHACWTPGAPGSHLQPCSATKWNFCLPLCCILGVSLLFKIHKKYINRKNLERWCLLADSRLGDLHVFSPMEWKWKLWVCSASQRIWSCEWFIPCLRPDLGSLFLWQIIGTAAWHSSTPLWPPPSAFLSPPERWSEFSLDRSIKINMNI